ncbi:MAG: ThiF family adenylyltransferase [Chloroflexi bacterium]|nr:ThiF family adenylyltransferase [Chloroflexota bacterium]
MASGYDEFTRQNWGFLSEEEQSRIAGTRVLLAGCGLGSNIALLAARQGFCRFIVADGDVVELSNLNRQAFRREHVGQNKARATASLVQEVNPQAQVHVIPFFLQAEDASALVQQCDVIVNMVDPGPALHGLMAAAREQGKFTLFPLNIGFGGILLAFGPESPTLEDLVGSDTDPALFVNIVERLIFSLPSYLLQYAWVAEKVKQERLAPPQLGVATAITAAMVVRGMVSVTLGSPLAVVPTVAILDSREPRLIGWPASRVSPVS